MLRDDLDHDNLSDSSVFLWVMSKRGKARILAYPAVTLVLRFFLMLDPSVHN